MNFLYLMMGMIDMATILTWPIMSNTACSPWFVGL